MSRKFLKTGTSLCILMIILLCTNCKMNKPVYSDPSQPIEKRVEDLLSRLTLEEKISLVHGNSKFTISSIERLGIPELTMSDGPNGVREDCLRDTWESAGRTDDSSTALPTQVVLACTWNTALAREQGEVLGAEARFRKKDIILAPGININRTPLCGRNFEYMGEDPYLTSRMAVEHIKGVQSQGTMACVKHFLANNQEFDRNFVNVEMDERTLREIYLPGFKAAITEGGALCVMGAYNKFCGQHCCHNQYLLNEVLKGEFGFKGLVMSDWDGCHSTDEAVSNGLDIEMGTEGGKKYNEYYLADPFLEGEKSGKYTQSQLDNKVRRVLYVMLQSCLSLNRPAGALNTPEHQKHCLQTAEEGIVLLKNKNNLLPLNIKSIKSIAVIGQNATMKHAKGGGSSYIKAKYEVSPLEGLKHLVGDTIKLNVAEGYSMKDSVDHKALIKEAVLAAGKSDVAIIFAGLTHVWQLNKQTNKGEGWDNESFDNKSWELPWEQDELIEAVVKANPKTIVVLISGSSVSIQSWIDKVPAMFYTSYAGMEAGNAIANLIFGKSNPSGKLCFTFPARLEDIPAHSLGKKAYPGTDHTVRYTEGILVGYRWFDAKNLNPLFCFGHGLSYTRFKYSDLVITPSSAKEKDTITVSFNILNEGKTGGAEVAQLYVNDEVCSVERPKKELKSFAKIYLNQGEVKNVTLKLGTDAFSFYDVKKKTFITEPGKFKIMVGSSAIDIRLNGEMEIQ
jgi:beta-glucosidase